MSNTNKNLTREEFLAKCTEISEMVAGAYSAFNHAQNPPLAIRRLLAATLKLNAFIDRLEKIPAFRVSLSDEEFNQVCDSLETRLDNFVKVDYSETGRRRDSE